MVILQKKKHIRNNREISQLILSCLDRWDNQDYEGLVSEAVHDMKSSLSSKRGSATLEEHLETFQHLMSRGEIRKAVQYISEREEASPIHQPKDIDVKSGSQVIDVLQDKHPSPNPDLTPTDLPSYDSVLVCPELCVSPEIVATVAQKLTGACGLGGTDAVTLRDWLLRHKKASRSLCQSLANLVAWMLNGIRPWAATRALMSNRLIALDKNPGVRPIGIGQIWCHLMAKVVVHLTGDLATAACGADQLCCGLKAGIEGGVHAATHFGTTLPMNLIVVSSSLMPKMRSMNWTAQSCSGLPAMNGPRLFTLCSTATNTMPFLWCTPLQGNVFFSTAKLV